MKYFGLQLTVNTSGLLVFFSHERALILQLPISIICCRNPWYVSKSLNRTPVPCVKGWQTQQVASGYAGDCYTAYSATFHFPRPVGCCSSSSVGFVVP